MNNNKTYCGSSIGRKQIVAITGLLLIGFIIGHLAGNFFIFFGPEAFNAYAKKLAGLRPGLYIVEFGLLILFVIHMYFTALLVLENIRARSKGYASFKSRGERTMAARIMPYTGTIILAFVVWHLLDFTFVDKHGPASFLPDGKSYGLYGIVYNSFASPMHSALYIISMLAIGFHLSHGVHSFMQTFGFNQASHAPLVKTISSCFGLFVAFAYSAIPVYVMFHYKTY